MYKNIIHIKRVITKVGSDRVFAMYMRMIIVFT